MYTTINASSIGINQKLLARSHMKDITVEAHVPPVFAMTKQLVGETLKKTFFYNFWHVMSAPIE